MKFPPHRVSTQVTKAIIDNACMTKDFFDELEEWSRCGGEMTTQTMCENDQIISDERDNDNHLSRSRLNPSWDAHVC